MGSGNSKKPEPINGSIELNTHETCYHAGETVSGEIYLELLIPFHEAQLFLNFEGVEAVYNRVTVWQQRRSKVKVLKRNKRTLHKQKHCLYSWDTLSPGQYVIPFVFTLPAIIPASFYHEDKPLDFSSYVRHKLKALLKSNVKAGPVLRKEINFVIRDRPMKPKFEIFVEDKHYLKSCYCIPRGFCIIRAYFEKNTYKPGERAKVKVEFDNLASQVENLEIQFMLRQKVRILGGCSLDNKFPILSDHCKAGVKAKSETATYELELRIPSFKGDDHNLDKRKWNTPKFRSGGVGATTRSTLVTSEYFLQVFCEMGGCCVMLVPEAICSVQIEIPDPPQRNLDLPAGWKPQKFGEVDVNFGFTKLTKIKEKDISKGMINPTMP